MEDINIKQIKHNSTEYELELELRNELLREPLGLNIYDEDLEQEKNDIHLGAFRKKELVGTLILKILNEQKLKMRQVAVKKSLQGNNIGTKLVKYAENYAVKNGYQIIKLNARKTAVPFYEKLGYEKIGDEFMEVSIPHFKMQKSLYK